MSSLGSCDAHHYSINLEPDQFDTWLLIGEPNRKRTGIHWKRLDLPIYIASLLQSEIFECKKLISFYRYVHN